MLASSRMNTFAYSFYYFWGYYFSAGYFAMSKHLKYSL